MDQSTLNRLVEKCGMQVHMWHAEEEVKSEFCTHGIDIFYYLHCDLFNIIVTAGFHSVLTGL